MRQCIETCHISYFRDCIFIGRVIIQMVISKDGSLSNIKVLRSVSPSLDAEAVRVVGNMPKWEPGMQKGQPVSVKYTIPIVFRLQ